jgi:hypothetical protein
MLICGIIDELKNSTADASLLSFFFCQGTDSRINNATAVLRGLIYLLVNEQSSLILHVRKKYDHAGKALFEDANAWVALSEIFANILQDPGLKSTYLIVDGLDECQKDLLQLLDLIVQMSSISPCVKWIVSSRNWLEIEKRLETAGEKVKLCLELNAESVSAAVGKYIRYKVDRLARLQKYDKKTRDAVRDHLSSNANGTFLWVALVCQHLEKVSRWNTLAKLNMNIFPPGLDALYERMMEQICNSDDVDICKRILACVTTVYRPITLNELTSFDDVLEATSDDLESLGEIIGLSSFITIQEGIVYFVHQSAKDFLLRKASDGIFPSGMQEVHYTIFSRSLQTLSRTLRRDIYGLHAPSFPVDQISEPDPDPLAAVRYSCIYWVDHLRDFDSSRNAKDELQDGGAVDKFLRQKYIYWLEALSFLRSMSEGVLLMAKLEGLLQVSLKSVVLFYYLGSALTSF